MRYYAHRGLRNNSGALVLPVFQMTYRKRCRLDRTLIHSWLLVLRKPTTCQRIHVLSTPTSKVQASFCSLSRFPDPSAHTSAEFIFKVPHEEHGTSVLSPPPPLPASCRLCLPIYFCAVSNAWSVQMIDSLVRLEQYRDAHTVHKTLSKLIPKEERACLEAYNAQVRWNFSRDGEGGGGGGGGG